MHIKDNHPKRSTQDNKLVTVASIYANNKEAKKNKQQFENLGTYAKNDNR